MGLFSSKPTPAPSLLNASTQTTPSLASSVNSAGSGFNSMSWWAKILVVLVGVGLIIFSAVLVYNAVAAANGKPGVSVTGAPTVPDQAPLPLDGKTLTTIPAANMPSLRERIMAFSFGCTLRTGIISLVRRKAFCSERIQLMQPSEIQIFLFMKLIIV
jgi:hypothetical protein